MIKALNFFSVCFSAVFITSDIVISIIALKSSYVATFFLQTLFTVNLMSIVFLSLVVLTDLYNKENKVKLVTTGSKVENTGKLIVGVNAKVSKDIETTGDDMEIRPGGKSFLFVNAKITRTKLIFRRVASFISVGSNLLTGLFLAINVFLTSIMPASVLIIFCLSFYSLAIFSFAVLAITTIADYGHHIKHSRKGLKIGQGATVSHYVNADGIDNCSTDLDYSGMNVIGDLTVISENLDDSNCHVL